MDISNATKYLIKNLGEHVILNRFIESEGYRLQSYNDTQGFWTIGIGHKLGKGDNYKNLKITSEEAIEYFWDDFDVAVLNAWRHFPSLDIHPLHVEFAIVEMCFILGYTGFRRFKRTIAYINNKNYSAAATEIYDSLWATQAPNRVRSVSNLFLGRY